MVRTILMHGGRSPMCRQSSLSIVGQRSRGSLSRLHLGFIFSAPLRSFTMKQSSLWSSTVKGAGKRRAEGRQLRRLLKRGPDRASGPPR
jgi:hypothetical protein